MQKGFKSMLIFLGVLLFRLVPFRPPNVEPLLAVLMPLSKRFRLLSSVLFSLFSIFVYDFFTAGIGNYTYSVAFCYAVIAVVSSVYFAKRKGTTMQFTIFAIFAVIFFDVVTGLIIGPLVLQQSVYIALMGQIPFTALHLMGSVMFTLILSPMVANFLDKDLAWFKKRKIFFVSNKNIV